MEKIKENMMTTTMSHKTLSCYNVYILCFYHLSNLIQIVQTVDCTMDQGIVSRQWMMIRSTVSCVSMNCGCAVLCCHSTTSVHSCLSCPASINNDVINQSLTIVQRSLPLHTFVTSEAPDQSKVFIEVEILKADTLKYFLIDPT